jgi:uncharacterized damage-inducible protein DinB
MELLTYLHKLFAHDDWANREVVRALQAAAQAPPRSAKLMAHVLAAESLWRGRMLQKPSQLAVWPELTLDQMTALVEELGAHWKNFLGALDRESGLARVVQYTNSKGEHWSNSVQDILMHVVMHSAYHRGQIAADMRASGLEPVYTDFIHGVRQKLVTS